VPSAFQTLDPFAVALWTLVACAFLFMLYVTLALGRFLRGIEDLRQRFDELSSEVCSTARALREALEDGRLDSGPAAAKPIRAPDPKQTPVVEAAVTEGRTNP
jgi:hypothetical protein